MANGCKTVTSKICLIIISLVFWGAAVSLCLVGSWVYSTYKNFDEITEASLTLVPASIIISGGIIMFIIGLIGCIAACKESKCLLAVFFSLILVVFLAEIVAGVMGYVYRHEMRQKVFVDFHDAIERYNETVEKNQIDYIQQELKCCGVDSPNDWAHAGNWSLYHNNTVPQSCCRNETGCTGTLEPRDPQIYDKGCLHLLEDVFDKNLIYIAGIAVSFAVIQFLGLICSCILICRSREVRYETLDSAQRNGLQV